MSILGKVKRTVKWAIGWEEKSAVILMYHRVVDVDTSPYHGIVSVDHFRQQMDYLHNRTKCLSLLELREAVKKNAVPKRSVVITFDDGYADNYHNAYPILKEYQLPATIFITSSYINTKREYWWDELERLILLPEKLPQSVPFALGDNKLDLNFARFDKDQRILLLRGLHGLLKSCRSADRETILASLRAISGLQENGREAFRPMTIAELVTLSRSGLVDIGAHTITHPALAALSREEQEEEIAGSIQAVGNMIETPVRTFAYPFGSAQDINKTSIEIIRSCGIPAAVTTTPGVVRANSDLAALPRIWVGDWDQKTFQRNLEPYFHV